MVDSPRRASARSKSPILASSPQSPEDHQDKQQQQQQPSTQKTTEKIAEERERRRERLLAGRDARLTKIVSSVGGTNFTPPSNIASPANIIHNTAPHTNTPTRAVDSEVRARPVSSVESKEHPVAGDAAIHVSPVSSLSSDKKSTLLVVFVNAGALLAAWHYLGRSCFKTVFQNGSPLQYGECGSKFETARKAYFGLLTCIVLPAVLAHLRTGNYGALISSGMSAVCLSVAMLVLIGAFIDRF
jgi:hypothetical protein